MHRFATYILTASALVPAATIAQTVRPQDQYEGTPQLALTQPAPKPGTITAPAPTARPTAPTPPTPPAGITWRNQAAPAPTLGKSMAPLPAPPPARVSTAPLPPPPPPPPARMSAAPPPPPPPPPVAAEPPRRFERIVVQRRPGELAGAGTRDILIRRNGGPGPAELREFEIIEQPPMHSGPARVFVHRSPAPDAYDDEPFYDDPAMHEDGYVEGAGYPDMRDGPAHHGGYHAQPGYQGYPGSGGMITETITTTTTYASTAEERVVNDRPRGRGRRR